MRFLLVERTTQEVVEAGEEERYDRAFPLSRVFRDLKGLRVQPRGWY